MRIQTAVLSQMQLKIIWYFNIHTKPLKKQTATRIYLLFNLFPTIIATSTGQLPLHSYKYGALATQKQQ